MMNIYDFDGTIYDGDSTRDFLIYCLKKHPSLVRFFPGQAVALGLYLLKKLDKTAFKERVYRMLSGCDAQALLEPFWDSHQEKIFPWYRQRQQQSDIVISASPEFLLAPICSRLGIRHLIASQVEITTGRCTGPNCRGEEKPLRLRRELGITHCREFYSDSLSDQPMADRADKAFFIQKGNIGPWPEKR